MSPGTISPLASIKALTFDVFGTVVDWRTSVIDELTLRAHRKLTSPASNLSPSLRTKLEDSPPDWARFAQAWRDSYGAFTKGFDAERDEWKTVDEHHRESLVRLLREYDLEGMYSEAEVESLSLVWHRLMPWEDSSKGLRMLKSEGGYQLATLSNGNTALLSDLVDFSPDGLAFDKLLSAETFGAYKPDPRTYRGAVEALLGEWEGRMGEVAMVAAHLGDLQAARGLGMRTVYVEREGEEAWGEEEERYKEAKEWVDLWIGLGEGGFESVARHLKTVR
ncbi:haloacid dehalogenase-like hydrolase domain-containing protein [Sarocladium implicatum]|jgi:2-haloacid dehalogenase|nr:haloacid dehalogenase-like hydrolase domain-containing protein [Sarocladium implicatum]